MPGDSASVVLLRRLLATLPASNLPGDVRDALLRGLEAWELGEELDLARGIGLTGQRYKYTTHARHGSVIEDRDGWIRLLASLADGPPTRQAGQIAGLIRCWLHDPRTAIVPPRSGDLLQQLKSIHEQQGAVRIPRSARQVQRILNRNRSG